MDGETVAGRFRDGLAAAAGVAPAALRRPGTTVVGREDRAGSGALACYRVDHHLLVWADPGAVDRVAAAGLTDDRATPDPEDLERLVRPAGFHRVASVVTNLLDGPPRSPGDLAQCGPGYRHRWLSGDGPGVLDAVRRFTGRCDPADIEAADLDELDELDELDGLPEDAINVVLAPAGPADGADPLPVVAYASASRWDWDPVLADIGVLVQADHRRRGLARFVVANTVARLLADGRIPLYRHERSNLGSRAVASGIGFRPVASLDYFVLRPPGT
jgi:RimJ/RimL family protein N-acetyltransferase